MTKPISVTVIPNGPLQVGAETLSVRFRGEPLELVDGQDVYLCRCGESKNAPFCDGSHTRTGFVAEPPSREPKAVRVWEGQTIKTFFNPNACMHVFDCKPLNDLRERELAGDTDAAAEIARVVQSCPSSALTYEAVTGEVPAPTPIDGPDIDIIEGGEIRLRSAFEINHALQERQDNDRATLCRCGLSRNKPWCDGRHKKREGFE